MPEPGQTYARTIKAAHILRDPSLETYRGYDTNNTSLRVFILVVLCSTVHCENLKCVFVIQLIYHVFYS